jgi:hypothetical protein
MTQPPPNSTTLLFQAPPDLPEVDHQAPSEEPSRRSPRQSQAASRSGDSGGGLRMLKGARQAATGMKLTDDQIRAVLEDPTDVAPDPNQPHRMRLTRDGITVTTGQDGMILRVTRRR